MTIKRIIADNMSSALGQVRQTLGPEAMILSNRRVDDGVELMVSDQLPELTELADTHSLEGDLAQLRSEVAELKAMLASPALRASPKRARGTSTRRHRQLSRLGFSRAVIEQLFAPDPADLLDDMPSRLARLLPTVGKDLIATGGVFAFVGPTGSGKSTTIAKLAASYVLANGADDIALVTMDTFGVAAHEQLRAMSRILKIPLQVVDRQHSLERALHDLRHKSVVLVDTAGFSRNDPRLQQQMACINGLGKRAKTLLVIPANSPRLVVETAYKTYRAKHLAGCVISKLDDAINFAAVLSFCIEGSIPLAYTTDGQDVPEAFTVANSGVLVRRLLDTTRAAARQRVLKRQQSDHAVAEKP